jgi:hypothetical protein
VSICLRNRRVSQLSSGEDKKDYLRQIIAQQPDVLPSLERAEEVSLLTKENCFSLLG